MSEQKIISIDSQALNAFSSCEAKLKYQMIDHIRSMEKPEAFERGDLAHIILKTFYRIKKARYDGKWKEGYDNKKWRDSCLAVGNYHATKLNISPEECASVIRSFNQYFEYKFNDNWVPLAVEEFAARVLFEDEKYKFIYTGILDLILQWRSTDPPILPVDHKSSSRFGEISPLSNQFYGYAWLLGTKRVLINRFGLQKTLKPEEKFKPEIMNYTQELIDEWQEDSIEYIKDMIGVIEKGRFRRNLTSCDKYSGCLFREICTADRRAREYRIKQRYQIGPKWEPVHLVD